MMDLIIIIPMVVVLIVLFFYLGWMFNSKVGKKSIVAAEEKAEQVIQDAKKEAANLKREKLLEVKDEWYKKKIEFDTEINQKKQKLSNLEKQIQQREENSEKKFDLVLQKEKELRKLEKQLQDFKVSLDDKSIEIKKLEVEQNDKLEKISGLTSEEAKKMLAENMVNQAKIDAAQTIKEIHDRAKMDAKKEAQKIIVQAIQRTAADYSIETTVSVVQIHPARIEEVVAKVTTDLEEGIQREGENTILQLGLQNMHAELVKHIGKMKYRSSYGQNLLQHSVEVAYLTGIMASELGLDPVMAKRAGLLHDVGKTVDKSIEGPHALLGYDLTKKYKEHAIVVNAVGSHHEDIEMEHPIAALVQSADAISGARPGARREPLESYVKRLENLEQLAN